MTSLPHDHAARMERVRLAMEGLSVGDALGQQFFYFPELIPACGLPAPTWHYTDDTAMGLCVAAVLDRHAGIERDVLAAAFAKEYTAEPSRGYGGTAHTILREIGAGVSWAAAAGRAFGGMGSMGNGGAMRAAPVGAYFADDLERAAREAALSAQVTHAHPEGQAGAIAVAVAAAEAWNLRGAAANVSGLRLLQVAWDWTPDGATREGILRAMELTPAASVELAVSALGNGSQTTAPDTVPFALWCAARHATDFESAFWTTVSGLGDRDTTCAIVGGIVALSASRDSIPDLWRLSCEGFSWRGLLD